MELLLNSSLQEAVRVKALDSIASIISRCYMRETIYHTRYELTGEGSLLPNSKYHSSHIAYRDALKMLYTEILTFQATWVCFFSEDGSTFLRVIKDSVTLVDWEPMLHKIEQREQNLKDMDVIWKDTTYQEDWGVKNAQHCERVRKLDELKQELLRLSNAVISAQQQSDRKELFKWLIKVDSSPDYIFTPSTNYNKSRDRRQANTGGWLVDKLETFQKWKTSPNSLLWLHGKGKVYRST